MKIFSIIIFTVIWVGLTDASLDVGYISISSSVIAICFAVSHKLELIPSSNGFNIKIIPYIFWLLKEILLSSINVSKIAWSYRLNIKPSLEVIPVKQNTSLGLTLYANSITLTPGTVSINASAEGLLVHGVDYSFIEDLNQGEMDRRVLSTIAAESRIFKALKDSKEQSASQEEGGGP